MTLQMHGDAMYVSGLTKKEMNIYRYQLGIHCLKCNTVAYSHYRHDFTSCECGECSVDGGRDYFKVSYEAGAKYEYVRLDLIKGEISVFKD
jgi:hypothetical protein